MEEMHEEQEPPYSKGLFFLAIRDRFLKQSIINKVIFSNLVEPIFTLMMRSNYIYSNPNMAKFAATKINENYRTFEENMHLRFPGYVLAKDGKIRAGSA